MMSITFREEAGKMDLQGEVKAVCQRVRGSEAVPDEILSDALEAVWDDDDSKPPAVQAWLEEVVRKRLATNGRRDRRYVARHASLEAIEASNLHAVGRKVLQSDPVVDAAIAKELRIVIARDDFEKEAVAASLGEHPNYEDFGEFARRQTYYSNAYAYKRRELIRQRLRENCTA
jgi:DNA-directed RNA polymerase specialized sigma24 family protein